MLLFAVLPPPVFEDYLVMFMCVYMVYIAVLLHS